MGAFFAIIAIVFGLPILYAIGWIIIAAVYGTKEGTIPWLRRHKKDKAHQKLEAHPNQRAGSIDQALCNDMLDFFYNRVKYYCDSDVDDGDMEEYRLSSKAFIDHRTTHNRLPSRLVEETSKTYGGSYSILWCVQSIKPNSDVMFLNLQKIYQTSNPNEYLQFVETHMNGGYRLHHAPTWRYEEDEVNQAYNSLAKVARISSDLHSIQLHCYLSWRQYEPTLIGLESSPVPRDNPSFADDLYNKYGVRPVKVKTLYDYKMQVLRKRLREAGIAGAQTYMQSGGISQVDYTKT